MRLDRNHYMRLKQIAFFMPDILSKDEEYLNENRLDISVDDPLLKIKIQSAIMHVQFLENKDLYREFLERMEIDDIEKILFKACLFIYEAINNLLVDGRFLQKPDYLILQLQENPKEACALLEELVEKGTLSLVQIKEKSKDAFNSIKSVCYFYNEFTPSYYLYRCSETIKRMESRFPYLINLKTELYHFFLMRPVDSFCELNASLSDLSASLDLFSSVESLSKNQSVSSFIVNKIYDWVIFNCLETSRMIPLKHGIPKPSDTETRKKMAQTQREKNSEREEKKKELYDRLLIDIDEEEKKTKKKRVVKKVCDYYFNNHKTELEELKITSSQTLQSFVSRFRNNKNSNEKRTAFANREYIKPNYNKKLRDEIKYLHDEFKASRQII